MSLSSFFDRSTSKTSTSREEHRLVSSIEKSGIAFRCEPPLTAWLRAHEKFSGTDLDRIFAFGQMLDDGYARVVEESLKIEWADFYRLASSPDHRGMLELLDLPPMASWRPSLISRGTFSDRDFAISISGWCDPSGQPVRGNVDICGALISAHGSSALLNEPAWMLVNDVAVFRQSTNADTTPDSKMRSWARIRASALQCGADLSNFLKNTVVLTPERLRIDLRKADIDGVKVIEVAPTFDEAPARWLEIFDRLSEVPERYEIPDGNGMAHVMLAPEVRTVLKQIRSMPGRRIAGELAEAFIRNPLSTLGPDAVAVIDPQQFEESREDAGISFPRFSVRVNRDGNGYPYEVSLLIEEVLKGVVRSEAVQFEGSTELRQFLEKLDARTASGAQCVHWKGYDLEILGDTPDQAKLLREILAEWSDRRKFSASDIFDLSRYSDRVSFGVEKPYYSPFIARLSEDGGWFPENVSFGLCYTPEGADETIAIALDAETFTQFQAELEIAQKEQRQSFNFPGCPKPIPVSWAAGALETLNLVKADVMRGTFKPKSRDTRSRCIERKGLVVKSNIDKIDYEERRGRLLPPAVPARIPSSLRTDRKLKDHQQDGLAWLQHLWMRSPSDCRGALLADDMGLGKTLQLLSFIAEILEREPDVNPFLVVAPVSLLENWREEIANFFVPGTFRVLTLYGDDLNAHRVPRDELDDELIETRARKLLRPGWLGAAQLVLTTYETMRDLEISLAQQRWSAVICDEAQKIKNPNAMVTRAAWKQNTRFRIACTGTPVENTLTDIWCLYNFVQPGLLGALKDFGDRYRKPIEAETDEEKQRVAELRSIIDPQILRRTKDQVANLPKKIEVAECRALTISDTQRAYYAAAVAAFKKRGQGDVSRGLRTPLGLLQYLRRLCSDPYPPGGRFQNAEPIVEVEKRSPKMRWLLTQLSVIESSGKDEKVIIFCEFRDLQRALQKAVVERFGFCPEIVNGDTATDVDHARSRLRVIRAFQDRPGFGVIILSPLAVGFGVNIQAANHVIHFTRTWNPAKEDQATDRAYRIGQTKDVFVYYPVVVADDFVTFDQKLDVLLSKRRSLATDILNGAGDVSASEFAELDGPGGNILFPDQVLGLSELQSLDPYAFEAFVALLWSKQGYATLQTPRTGDGGVDVVAISGGQGALIQCKSSSTEGKQLGWDAVKDVVAGAARYSAMHPGVRFQLVAVTNQYFNETARVQAEVNRVELVEIDELLRRLETQPVTQRELSAFLFSGWSKGV